MKKIKNIFLFLLTTLLIFSVSLGNEIKIKVNGKYIKTDIPPFIEAGTTYVPIRFISNALDAESIGWDANSKTIRIVNGTDKIMLVVGRNYAYINVTYVSLSSAPIIIDGRTFVPLRFISQSFGADVNWNDKTYTVTITTKNSNNASSSNNNASTSTPSRGESNRPSTPPTSSSTNYTEDEVYWLSRIIQAEAGGEPFKGKVAVGEVILNRVKSPDYPNTIWGVIFDHKFGIQFEPTINGSIYNTPSEESIKAAKTALSGSNYVGECLYFLNPRTAQSNWITKNRTFYMTINNHDFYL